MPFRVSLGHILFLPIYQGVGRVGLPLFRWKDDLEDIVGLPLIGIEESVGSAPAH